jgi:acyl-CoA synthetase
MQSVARRIAALARSRPDAVAYLGGGPPLGWSEYDAATHALAVLLRKRLAAERGDRIAILLPDGPGVHVALVGCERAGLVAVGIGPRAGLREIRHLIGLSGARCLIGRAEHQGHRMAEIVAGWRAEGLGLDHHIEIDAELRLGTRLRVDGTPFDLTAGNTSEGGEMSLQLDESLQPDEVFLINSTSGTTGMPKCVIHDQARWHAFHALAVRHGRLSSDDVFMSVVPAPFGFGIWTSHVTPTLLGVPTVVMPRFDAGEALDLIERHRVSVLAAVSTQFILMLEAADTRPRDLSSLRILFTGGEAVPYARAAAFEEATGAAVLQFYGSNETGAVSGTSVDDSRDKRLRTAGRPIPEMHVRLFDESGADVTRTGAGQPGCRGPTLSRGYFGAGDEVARANAALLRPDGWMLLGDRVVIDAEGYLRVVGRIDDFIIRGGKNISGPGVEEQVASHPAVALAAAVAMPDPIFGERVCVYVELRPGFDALELGDLTRHLADREVSKETWPERIVVLDELPRGSGGKIAKQVLRDDIRRRLASEGAPH